MSFTLDELKLQAARDQHKGHGRSSTLTLTASFTQRFPLPSALHGIATFRLYHCPRLWYGKTTFRLLDIPHNIRQEIYSILNPVTSYVSIDEARPADGSIGAPRIRCRDLLLQTCAELSNALLGVPTGSSSSIGDRGWLRKDTTPDRVTHSLATRHSSDHVLADKAPETPSRQDLSRYLDLVYLMMTIRRLFCEHLIGEHLGLNLLGVDSLHRLLLHVLRYRIVTRLWFERRFLSNQRRLCARTDVTFPELEDTRLEDCRSAPL